VDAVMELGEDVDAVVVDRQPAAGRADVIAVLMIGDAAPRPDYLLRAPR